MKYTLLTGGSGLVGQWLLMELLRHQVPVAVFARHKNGYSPSERLDHLLARFESRLQQLLPRPVVLEGDLCSEGLGITQTDERWLRSNCGNVIHSAASLSFKPASQHPAGEPFRTNVEGTRRLVEVCRKARIQEFHYVSSAYICGQRTGRVLESEGANGQLFANDYECSKLTAEQHLRSCFPSGRLTIYRPSIVIDTDPGSPGISDRTIYLAFSMYQLIAQRFGLPEPEAVLATLGLTGSERKNIVAADWVARMLCQIFRRPDLHGRTYHLTHPQGTCVIDMVRAFRQVLADQGYAPVKLPPDTRFGDLDPSVGQFVETFAPYFRDDPDFDRTQLQTAMQQCGESDATVIGIETLRGIASRQRKLSTAEPCRQSKSPVADIPLLETLPATSRLRCRLLLIGPRGGDWILSLQPDGRVLRAQGDSGSAELTAYLSADSWCELLEQRRTIRDLLQCGRLSLERGNTGAPDGCLVENFQRIIASLTGVSDFSARRSMEVGLHAK
jgi:nucleoside-diphosphate-sugar epimerase